MNPGWFFVGLAIADRIGPERIRKAVKTVVRETWWYVEEQVATQRLITAHNRFLNSLPVEEKGVSE